uniref:Uncharacterized protein n=1 Tax=Arundo donax TaxID=35708 RepID=A0A0A8YUW0_ARUDO
MLTSYRSHLPFNFPYLL